MLKVGLIDYVNAYPLTAAFRSRAIDPGMTLTYDIPTRLNALMASNALDGSYVSSVESYEHYLPFGIVANNEVLSVNLYFKSSIEKLDGAPLGLTHHSAASVALLKVLCSRFWKITPSFQPLDRPYTSYEGILLIGDEALKYQQLANFYTLDLAASWHKHTGLPFVFARFAMQNPHCNTFAQLQRRALEWSEAHRDEVVDLAHAHSFLPKSLLKRYYSLLHYEIGPKEEEGLKLFEKLCLSERIT